MLTLGENGLRTRKENERLRYQSATLEVNQNRAAPKSRWLRSESGEALQAGPIDERGAVCAGRFRYVAMSFGDLKAIAYRREAGRDDQCGDTIVRLLLRIARILVHGTLDSPKPQRIPLSIGGG